MEAATQDGGLLMKYDGSNFSQWKIAVTAELKIIELTCKEEDEEIKEMLVNAKGVRLIIRMLQSDKIKLLECYDCK